MSDELLSEIVAVERDIRKGLLVVEEECAAQLAAAQSEAEEAIRRERETLESELARALEEATRAARSEAREVVAGAEAYARRLASHPDDVLEALILRHLRSPDGEAPP